jgi:release factor glutamine methyltransferase
MPEEEFDRYMELIQRRSARIPLQQLTGEQQFMGLPFHVSEDVLTPRQDTEILVEEALKRARPGAKILDLCTGSGCILISLLKLGPDLEGTGSDLSEKALEIAAENAEMNKVEVSFVQSDLFARIPGTFDMIVSNPPYIVSSVISSLMEEVRDHEPLMALDGGTDGLDFYRRIVPESMDHLNPGGWLIVEIGYDQGDLVRSMFIDHQYEDVDVIRDLGGNDRVVLGRKAIV